MTLSSVPTARTARRGLAAERPRRPLVASAVTTWSPLVVPTHAAYGSVNTAAGSFF